MSALISLSTSWKQHFASLPENDDGDRNMMAFSVALAAGQTSSEKLKQLVDEIESIILVANEKNEITIIHSISNLGGTRSRPENKIVGLVGTGARATCVLLAWEKAVDDCNLITPTFDDIENCEEAGLIDLEVTANPGVVTYPGSNSFIPAPWVRGVILESGFENPAAIIKLIIDAAMDFDAKHDEDESIGEGAALAHATDLTLWLFGVLKGNVPETRFSILPDDGELRNYEIDRHKSCIFSPLEGGEVGEVASPVDTNSALRQVSNCISTMSEETFRANSLREKEFDRLQKKDDAKKDRLKKLHRTVTNTILMASGSPDTTGGESELLAPSEVVDSCRAIFNSETAALADQELSSQFADLGLKEVVYAHGTIQAIIHGFFLYGVGGSPSNFSAFCFGEHNPTDESPLDRCLVLHIMATQGRGKTMDDIKGMSKQTVEVPSNYQDLIDRLKIFGAACQIFFGKNSLIVSRLLSLRREFKNEKTILKAKIIDDKSLPAKILFSVDSKTQRWLRSCMEADDRSEVNDSIINFRPLVDLVLEGQFVQTLPPVFSMNSNRMKERDFDPPTKKARSEKDKNDDKGKRAFEKNDTQIDSFKLKDGETWGNFCGTCAESKPDWAPKKMCHRWNIRGYCFNDCVNKASHVAGSEIPKEKEKEFQTWMSMCRRMN